MPLIRVWPSKQQRDTERGLARFSTRDRNKGKKQKENKWKT